MNKIVLNCEKCGGTLEVTDDMELFRCEYCGMPYLVERKGGAVHITRLEARVTRVEREQEKVRLDMLRSKLEGVRSDIEQFYDQLSSVADGKPYSQFRLESAARLYQEELKLRQDYIRRGGNDVTLEGYINVLEMIPVLQPLFPKSTLGVGLGRETTHTLGPSGFCPGISRSYWGRLSPIAFVEVMRYSNVIKVKMKGRRLKRQVAAILRERYPHRLIKVYLKL